MKPKEDFSDFSYYEQLMEEMANVPKEEFGKRQPGEKQASEKFLGDIF